MSAYKKIDENDYKAILSIVPEERVLYKDNINEEYSHDELSSERSYPDIVVRVTSAEEVSKLMAYAKEHNIVVTPRGAGTGLVGASVAVEHGLMIDMTLMNHILELDEKNLTLTVEPGVLLMEIAAYVEERGFFYPPDPGEKSATIGGNISTNAGGMRAVKYGVTRDFVRGLEVVLTDGTILHLGGKVVKNSSGYDIKDMIIGSEGTLGIVTKAILKLLPRFPLLQRWKRAGTVVALIAIVGILVPVVWYSGVNAKEHSAIVSQIKEGKNLIVLDSKPFPELIDKNVCRTINFYSSGIEVYDPDGNLCSAIAANFKEVEFLSFCPKPVYDTYLNNPEKLSDVTDLDSLPLYVIKLDEPVQLDAVYLNFRAAEKDEIPLLLRPFAGWLSKYQERRFNAEFAIANYDGDTFLYIEKPDGYDGRLTEVEVVESDPDATMPDYGPWDVDLPESNLPIVMVDTRGKDGEQQYFDRNERKVMRMKVIMNPDGTNYGDTIDHPGQHADFDGWVAMRYRGSNSYVNSPKKPYSVKTIMTGDAESRGLKTPMMGMPADDDWVLIAPYQDRSQIRDVLMFELARPWMEYVPRARHCELVIDGIYQGIYIMAERPGKGKNRLNLEKTGNEGLELTGGYLLEVDRDEEGKYFTSDYVRMDEDSTEYPVYVQLKYPRYNKITDRQLEYIQGRFREMEDALLSDQFADPQNGYRKYIDEQSFIDYMLSQEASLNIDGYRLSAYLYKHRDDVDSRFKTTLWDFNLAFGNTNLCGGYLTDFWGYDNPYIPDDEPIRNPFWWERLTEDPAFMQKLKSRWAEYRRGSYSDAHVEAVIDSLTSMLDEIDALDRNFKRWNTWGEPMWGVYAWKEADTYKEEISYLKDWIRKRFSWMDRQLGR